MAISDDAGPVVIGVGRFRAYLPLMIDPADAGVDKEEPWQVISRSMS